MSQVEMKMPKMGESVAEATIIKWLKKEGDKVEADESVLEIATDKVDSEVPSSVAGTITKILFKEGDVVQVGSVIATIETGAASQVSTPAINDTKPQPAEASAPALASTPVPFVHASDSISSSTISNSENRFYSPLVRTIAKEEKISQTELDSITGTGAEGRVTKKDVMIFLERRKTGIQPIASVPAPVVAQAPSVAPAAATTATNTATGIGVSLNGDVEIIEMDRMRKIIAEHMVMSKRTSPHVTSYVEADVTNLVMWRNKIKNSFEKRENEKITFTPIFIEAIARAIRDFPMINVSVDGTNIIVKKNINIGMAAALPSGNLIVPVIKNADRMNLLGLTKSVNDLANRARAGKLAPEEIQGGTYTLTNVGSFGNVMGTPIIPQPQVAIMAVGAIRKKPAVIETPYGDTIGIRHMMFLSHSYDHRVIDGALGGSFVRRVADYLEQFDINREI
ncbi:MAG: dihydrolipoamide acetyltransferase family protein [Bacteroidota bacterium]|jgi:2-oxoglutarate dehydrogenase E2 component (dihydrolipoamide succinyltransferase)